jgi:tRNA modification GTPase
VSSPLQLRFLTSADDPAALQRSRAEVAIVGRSNVGKSSLLNALAHRDRAIVTEVPGTTRDVLRESVDLDGIPLHLIDTAGLRDTRDLIEAEGVRRARAEIGSADCLLFLVDAAAGEASPRSREEVAARVGAAIPERVVLVHNKIDLTGEPAGVSGGALTRVAVSLKTGDGMGALVAHLKELVGYADAGQNQYTARARHLDALERAGQALWDAASTLEATGAGDLVAEDLRRGHDALGEIVGALSADDLLGEIFSSFCIGK